MKVIRIENKDNALMEIAKYIRCEVFVKEQNVPLEEDWDEEESENYLIYDEDKPVGTMRWRDIGDKIKIERVAVLADCRGKGIATVLLKQVIEENYLNIWLYEDKKTIITEEMRFFTTYHVQGCLSVLNRWVESNYKYSKKELLELLQKLNDHIEKIMP